MAEQAARRRHQDDLAALALLEHLPAGGARHQPGLRDVGVHHVEEVLGLLVDDLRHLVDAGGDHENVDAAEAFDRGVDDARRNWPPSSAAWRRSRPCRRAPRIRPRPSSAPARAVAQITTLAPAPASTFAASAPNAPVAPVTIAVLPLTLNSDSGSFRKSSDMCHSRFDRHAYPRHGRARPGHLDSHGPYVYRDRPASSPAMTAVLWTAAITSRRRRGDRDEDGADLVAAVDDLAALVRADVAGVAASSARSPCRRRSPSARPPARNRPSPAARRPARRRRRAGSARCRRSAPCEPPTSAPNSRNDRVVAMVRRLVGLRLGKLA